MEKYIGLKKALGFCVLLFGAGWVLNTLGLLIALLTGFESFGEYFNKPVHIDGEETSPISFGMWKAMFWVTFGSAIGIKLLGGKLTNISLNGYDED